jgi:hypothetical protein
MRNVSDKICSEKQNTILCSITFFLNRAFYEIMWKNIVERGRPQMTIWRTRNACWIPKAANTHSEYVILIAGPQQQCLHERTQYYVTRTLPVLLITMLTVYCLIHSQNPGTIHMSTNSICTVHSGSWQPCPPVPHIYALDPI